MPTIEMADADPRPRSEQRLRRRKARAFPGEQAWLWHNQLQAERIVSPVRAAAIVATALTWFVTAHASAGFGVLTDAIAAFSLVYAAFDLYVVYRDPNLVRPLPWGSTAIDFALVFAWIVATGGPQSPFVALAFFGVVSATLRLAWRAAGLTAILYALAFVFAAGPQRWLDAAYLLLCGASLAMWTASARRERRSSLRDDLTGCFNREYASFRLGDIYESAAFPVAIAAIDLDGFKHVNDTLGHAAGDALLIQAVRNIGSAIRHNDLLARSGGDEFLLVLPRTGAQTARIIADRVRLCVSHARYRLRRDVAPVRITASIGVAVSLDAATSPTDLLELADARLYQAKASGRNRIADRQ